MTAPTKRPRKVLGKWGPHGDSVRAVVDPSADAVLVYYRDAAGIARKKSFANDAAGRREAVAWGASYHATRAARLAAPEAPKVTARGLWDAYTAAPAYHDLADATQVNYAQNWRRWERFVGRDAFPDDTTLHHVDRFTRAALAAGIAANQVRQAINVARIVYTWGESRKLVRTNELARYRWRMPKGHAVLEPEEYTEAEFAALLNVLSPQDGRTWRAHVALMLAGHHGQRARAVLHLRWSDVDAAAGEIKWPKAFQKTKRDLVQPLTWEAVAALETARTWRERSGYTGPWVLYAGGGNKQLGAVVTGNARHYRKARTPEQDTPMTYGGLWAALRKAERRAKVEHRERRALHGFRKMAAGNVADRTNDARLGLEWIGDTDLKMAKKYLKARDERLDRAAAAAGTTPNGDRR